MSYFFVLKRKNINENICLMFKAQEEGEEMCTDMLLVACGNYTEATPSENFCLDFCFFSGAC